MNQSADSSPSPRRYVVVSSGLPIGRRVAEAVANHGAHAALVRQHGERSASDLRSIECDFADHGALTHALGEADEAVGGADLFVLCAVPPISTKSAPLIALSDADWSQSCGDAILDLLHMFKAVSAALDGRDAAVAVLGASFAYSGAKGLVALSAALEGQRGMTKSVARQWGERGVSVNWIALAADALSDAFDGAELPFKMDAVQIALQRRPSLEQDLPGVLAFLASPQGRSLTGANINLDGGEWMTP